MESVGRLAGGVAHDFNNLLQVILGHAEMAMESLSPDALPCGHLRQVRDAAQRSVDLTRQLLAFARKQDIIPRVVDLNQVISQTLKMLQRLIGEDIKLIWETGRDLWHVKIDPAQVDQVLANLAANSRDAIEGVGSLTVSTSNEEIDDKRCKSRDVCLPGEYVVMRVIDTGKGMSSDVLEHIFEPFFTTKEIGQGTGLGLATVYGIVKQNKGFINVESRLGAAEQK